MTSKPEKALVLLNPKSGTSKLEKLLTLLNKHELWFDVVHTNYAGHLSEIVQEKINDYRIFIAAGGDGTVNELAQNLVGTDRILGIIPRGSGNGFARELGFNKGIKHLVKAIQKANFSLVDTLDLNEHFFINMAGFGLDSHVAHLFQNRKKRGLWNYAKCTLRALQTFTPLAATIKGPNALNVQGTFYLIGIANTRQFGNNAKIAPGAKPDDGIFELVLIRKIPVLYYLQFLYQLFTGRLAKSKFVEYISCSENISIESQKEEFHIDGEPVFINGAAQVSIQKQNLRVLKMA